MSLSDPIRNFNDGVNCYQDIAHSAGVHLEPIKSQTNQEITEQMDRIEEAKNKIHNNQKIQKLNRLNNYLLEAQEAV